MTHEEIQIQQIDKNISGLERRIELLKKGPKTTDTPDTIIKIEKIIADLKGSRVWHERRLNLDKGKT